MKASPEDVERIEGEVRQRSLKRLLDRQRRQLPITMSSVNRIVKDEAKRVCALFRLSAELIERSAGC
jgi:hypothetical protein